MGYTEKKVRKKGRGEDLPPLTAVFKSSLIGFGAAVVSALVLWVVASLIAYACDDPDSVVGALGLSVIYLSALIGGFVAVRYNKKDALICGMLSGAMLTLLFFVISLLFEDNSSYSLLTELLLRGAMMLMSVFGAFAGLHRKDRRRKRR